MTDPGLQVAVLISGTGSNLKTLIDAIAAGRLDVRICLVISNRADAPGLDHARQAGIRTEVIDRDSCAPGQTQDQAVGEALRRAGAELVLLSGYMRILGAELVAGFQGRMINQHPSLLPRFKGLDTYRRVLEAGEPEHGASVHFVTAELDDGPVIAQARIPVEPEDDEVSLARRLGPVEHRLLVAVMELFADRRVSMGQGAVLLDQAPLSQPLEFREGLLNV